MPAHAHRSRSLAALIAAAALVVLPACGDDDDEEETTAATAAATAAATTAEPATTEAATTAEATTTEATEATEATETSAATEPAESTDAATTAADATTGAATGAGGPDEEAVRAAIQGYLDAFVAKDGATACDLLTDEAEQAFLDAIQGQTDCATAFQTAADQAGDTTLQALGLAEIGPITVTGDTATTTVGVLGIEQEVTLERVDGEWKVASLPGQP